MSIKQRLLISLIVEKAMLISNSKDIKADIFVDYKAHINGFGVYGYLDGWTLSADPNYKAGAYTIYLNYKDCMEELKGILEDLEQIEKGEYINEPR